eukprot:6460437-Amphidinium_carterae.1
MLLLLLFFAFAAMLYEFVRVILAALLLEVLLALLLRVGTYVDDKGVKRRGEWSCGQHVHWLSKG